MHPVVTENKFLVDFTKKVRMRHQNVFAHPETDEALIAGKNTSRVASNDVANCVPKCVNIQGSPSTHILCCSCRWVTGLSWNDEKLGGVHELKRPQKCCPRFREHIVIAPICLMTLVLLGKERSYLMFWKKKKTFASHRIIESDVALRGFKLNRSDLLEHGELL